MKQEQPILSIIIPNYNNEAYLVRCLNSIFRSDSSNFEVIVVDDGSTDNSLEVLNAYKDNRLRVISQKNQGVSVARNNGMEQSRGAYILFCDPDDMYEDNAIDIILNYITSNDSVETLVLFNVSTATEKNLEVVEKTPNDIVKSISDADNPLEQYIKNLYNGKPRFNGPWGKIYNAKTIKENQIKFPEGVVRGQDRIFNMRYVNFCHTLKCLDEYIYIYFYQSSAYTSGKTIRTEREFSQLRIRNKLGLETIEKNLSRIPQERLQAWYINACRVTLFRLIKMMLKQGCYSCKEIKTMIQDNQLEYLVQLPIKLSDGFYNGVRFGLMKLFYLFF